MNPSPSNYRSSSDQASIYTQGGTRVPAVAAVTNVRDVAAIMREIKAIVALLVEYLRLVNDEFKKPQSQMARSIRSGLRIAEYIIHSLQRHIEVSYRNPGSLVDIVRGIDFTQFPTYLSLFEANPTQHGDRQYHTGHLDLPAMTLMEAKRRQEDVLEAWNARVKEVSRVSPSKFANLGWHEMQKEETALLCHRPASNRPHLPLEIMHLAFYEFVKKAELCDAELADFHEVAGALCRHLTDSLERENVRANLILQELKKVFPNDTQTRWDTMGSTGPEYLCYKRIVTADNHIPGSTNLIIVKVKLEEGENGDAFMHVSRFYGNIVEGNPGCHETGAPMFLITISGMFISDMRIFLLTIFGICL